VVTANQQRAAVDWLREAYGVSQRRAGGVLGRPRSTLRYRRDRPAERPLAREARRPARKHPRWGYRRVHAALERDGWRVNLKRAHRPWRELGLKRPVRRREGRELGAKRGSSANSCVNAPARFKDGVWTYDFVADRASDGRTLKWLTVVGEHARECLALRVDRPLTGQGARRVLGRVVARRGPPKRIRSDNGSESVREALTRWLPGKGTEATPVAPGSPWENGYCESFNSRFRDEFLEIQELESVPDARLKAAWFRRERNTIRPHSALSYRTPRQFSDECARPLPPKPMQARRKKDVSSPK
jgi:putative transposase